MRAQVELRSEDEVVSTRQVIQSVWLDEPEGGPVGGCGFIIRPDGAGVLTDAIALAARAGVATRKCSQV